VEWALLDRRSAEGPFLAVPGDSHPFLGSRDVEVETSSGLLRLRCQAGLWLEPSAFEPDFRVGTLEPDGLDQARRKIREVAQRGFAPDPFLEETDLSPEYEEWMRDVIWPARAAVDSLGTAPTFQPSRRLLWGWMAAAAVLLLVCSGLVLWVLRQSRQIDRLAARSTSSEAALSAERAQREEAQRTAAKAVNMREERERELQARLSALEGRVEAPAQPLLNPPVAILQPADVLRGTTPKSYKMPATSPALTVVLKFRETEIYPAYRLTLTRDGNTKPIWSTDGLERSTEGVQLALPQRYIPPGQYRLSLSGLHSGKAQPVADYELTVTR
jgi:hypothetical protein